MKANFEIEDLVAVNINGDYIDIHNNFELSRRKEIDNDFIIEFSVVKNDWVKKNEFKKLIFYFKNVNYKFLEIEDPNAADNDKSTLSEITFYPNSQRSVNDCMILQQKIKENDDIIFSFEDGSRIRLNADSLELITNPN